MRLAVTHPNKLALALFAREIAPAGTSWSPGTTGSGGGRSGVSASIRQFAFLLPKSELTPVVVEGESRTVVSMAGDDGAPREPAPSEAPVAATAPSGETVDVPLIRLAWGRSGDKGDISNIGLIARKPAYLPYLRHALTPERVREWLGHLVKGPVTRYDLPGIGAMNFVCEQALGGGGMASLRNDPLGKGMAQILLSMPVTMPVSELQ
jgi:hypothetical protein